MVADNLGYSYRISILYVEFLYYQLPNKACFSIPAWFPSQGARFSVPDAGKC